MIVVVGSGIAGMCAAVEAASAGCPVIVLEKDKTIGGNSKWAGGFDIESDTFADMRINDPEGDPILQQMLVDRFQTDLTWLKALGVELEEVRPGRFNYAPYIGEGGVRAFRRLRQVLEENGGKILLETPMIKLISNERGAVTGVIAKGPEGNIRIEADGVILATGSFAQSNDLKARYLGPYGDRAGYYGTDCHHGDGLLAAMAVGAVLSTGLSIPDGGCVFAPPFAAPAGLYKLEVLELETSEPVPAGVQNFAIKPPAWRGDNIILINLNGKRYVDESARYTVIGWKTTCQLEGMAFCVFDQTVYEARAKTIRKAVEYGATLYQGDSSEELGRQMKCWKMTQSYHEGVDVRAFLRTWAEYNEAVEKGTALDLYPPRGGSPQQVASPPFYAMPVVQGVVDVIGGIRINDKSQALDSTNTPIPGLFVAGEDAGRPYSVEHGGLSFGLVTGRTAGRIATAISRSSE
jgi:succinate dehydrogenase/fumarate reductase flavoprotein subunit